MRMLLGLGVLAGAIAIGGVMWLKNKLFVINPGKGAPLGTTVRTDRHIATLIQTLEPYTPSPNRDHSKDTYAVSLFVVPLDGGQPALVPISGGHAGNSLGLAKVLGSDGESLWYDVKGVGAIDLGSFRIREGAARRDRAPADLRGASTFPLQPRIESFLSAAFFTGRDTWLGLASVQEAERSFRPGLWIRPIVPAESAKQMRKFHRGAIDSDVAVTGSRKLVSMESLDGAEYLNAAFLRMDDKSEPIRLRDPDGALVIYTSAPGLKGTLMVARVDNGGRVLWSADTSIDRFTLRQILPGEEMVAFVGTRLPAPDKVSEPLLVLVDNRTGALQTHSLWR